MILTKALKAYQWELVKYLALPWYKRWFTAKPVEPKEESTKEESNAATDKN